ncbi:MAG: hypothetical protein KAI17_06250 [Thiotrichaceae bacterium]|nr:hypothetical protein [Thiotrichaceae bacterium]
MLINSDTHEFQALFKDKLSEMLSPDELGSFILVLFNSMQDVNLQKALAPKLEATFDSLKSNKNLQTSPDDFCVFEALKKTGISQYEAWQTRQIEYWNCAYNPLRALRPERSSKEKFGGLEQPFNIDAFHFSKPFLKPEILSEESFENTALQIMYHKFPFAPYHLLIVIEASKHKPQHFDENAHKMTWDLAIHCENNISGFGLAYNSLGAGASINQLHIHGFSDDKLLAIEQKNWSHNGGKDTHPLEVNGFSSAHSSWILIEKYHQQNQPYNLLYRSEICYLIKRKPQSEVNLPEWLANVGWYEACGGFNLSDKHYYESLTAGALSTI